MTAVLDAPPLARAFKPVDAWWTVVAVDPLARRLLPPLLARSWVTPTRVTGAALVVGLLSVGALASGHLVAGALLYELRFLLDCLDGKIARVRGTSSRTGAVLDRLADAVTVPAALTAVCAVLASQGHLPPALVLAPAVASLLVALLEAVLELVRSAAGDAPAPTPTAPPTGLVGWARRRRLTLRPWTVEIETVGLFLGPLLLAGGALAAVEMAVVASYLCCAAVDLLLVLRTTRAADA